MKCHLRGAEIKLNTDLLFKRRGNSIVIIKNLPVWQRRNCNEYLLEDGVMAKIDVLLGRVDAPVEAKILSLPSESERFRIWCGSR